MGWFGDNKKAPTIDPATGKPRKGIFGRFADNRRAHRDATAAQAEADKLANTTPVAPPPTALIGSTNVDLARAAAERMRKRTGGGSLGAVGVSGKQGPKAKLTPRTLIGGGGY